MKGIAFSAASPLVQFIGPIGNPRVYVYRLVGLVRTWPAVASAMSFGDWSSRKSTCRVSLLLAQPRRLFWLHVHVPFFGSLTV